MSELTYINKNGYTVFKSEFHMKRGTCCKSSCLHCPYGWTVKKHGLQFRDITLEDEVLLDDLIGRDLWEKESSENIKVVSLKDHVAGVIIKNHIIVKNMYLLPEFSDQGLSKELVESYYFI